MCLNPIRLGSRLVPCGKCDECLQRLEYKLGFAGVANLGKYEYVHSITLTYDEAHVPLAVRNLVVDTEKRLYGIFEGIEGYTVMNDDSLSLLGRDLRDVWNSRNKYSTDGLVWLGDVSPSPCFIESLRDYQFIGILNDMQFSDYCEMYNCGKESIFIYSYLTAVADSSHLQNFIKTIRVYYDRFFGKAMDLTYTAVAEYGPLTCRPHYHVCMFTNDVDIPFLQSFFHLSGHEDSTFEGHKIKGWRHGNCCIRTTSKSDMKFATNVAKYTAKYGKKQSKGRHLNEDLHLVPMRRRLTSKGFYNCVEDAVKNQILHDIPYTNYMDDFESLENQHLPTPSEDPQLWEYADMIVRRMSCKYSIYGKEYKIPFPWLTKVLTAQYSRTITNYYIDENGKMLFEEVHKPCSRTSLLSKAVGALQGFADLQEMLRAVQELQDQLGLDYGSALDEVRRRQTDNVLSRKFDFEKFNSKRYDEPNIDFELYY